MPFLSPAKILIILVVALVVLGPEKLPKVAHDVGRYWSEFQKFRQRMEDEVRANMPDLPSTSTIVQAVRSPISFLDGLAASSTAAIGATVAGASPGQSGADPIEGAGGGPPGAAGPADPDAPAVGEGGAGDPGTGVPGSVPVPGAGPEAAPAGGRAAVPAGARTGPRMAARTWDDYRAVPDDTGLN